MIFTKHADGRITVDEWADECLITKELLTHVPPERTMLFGSGDRLRVRIKVDNGWAYYRILGESPDGSAIRCTLRRSRLTPPGNPDAPARASAPGRLDEGVGQDGVC